MKEIKFFAAEKIGKRNKVENGTALLYKSQSHYNNYLVFSRRDRTFPWHPLQTMPAKSLSKERENIMCNFLCVAAVFFGGKNDGSFVSRTSNIFAKTHPPAWCRHKWKNREKRTSNSHALLDAKNEKSLQPAD